MIDLRPACQRTADVLAGVTDEQLNLPTPCEKLPLNAMIAHIGMLAQAFAAAARKDFGPMTDTPPEDDVHIDSDWRSAYPQRLEYRSHSLGIDRRRRRGGRGGNVLGGNWER